MRTNFPPTLNLSISSMEDIRSWLPDFAGVPSSRELVLVDFDIRAIGDLIANFDKSQVSMEQNESEVAATSSGPEYTVPKPSNPLLATSIRSTRSTRSQAGKDERIDPVATASEVPSDSIVQVKRPVRTKKASEGVEEVKGVEF